MKLLDQCRHVARVCHLAYSTEKSYVHWIERYTRFHGIRHPNTLGVLEVEAFLTHLAVTDHVSARTQNQALGALLFLYRDVLKMDVGNLDAVRARSPKRVSDLHACDEQSGATGSQSAGRYASQGRCHLLNAAENGCRVLRGAFVCKSPEMLIIPLTLDRKGRYKRSWITDRPDTS